jgi:hypothetical protein
MNAIENYRAFMDKTKDDMEVIAIKKENERVTV